jgi:hypothetical protein
LARHSPLKLRKGGCSGEEKACAYQPIGQTCQAALWFAVGVGNDGNDTCIGSASHRHLFVLLLLALLAGIVRHISASPCCFRGLDRGEAVLLYLPTRRCEYGVRSSSGADKSSQFQLEISKQTDTSRCTSFCLTTYRQPIVSGPRGRPDLALIVFLCISAGHSLSPWYRRKMCPVLRTRYCKDKDILEAAKDPAWNTWNRASVQWSIPNPIALAPWQPWTVWILQDTDCASHAPPPPSGSSVLAGHGFVSRGSIDR